MGYCAVCRANQIESIPIWMEAMKLVSLLWKIDCCGANVIDTVALRWNKSTKDERGAHTLKLMRHTIQAQALIKVIK